MTAEVELALIGLASLCVNAWIAFHQGQLSKNITKIEVATNSMKDQLVMATGLAAHAQGLAQGLAQGRADEKMETALSKEKPKT